MLNSRPTAAVLAGAALAAVCFVTGASAQTAQQGQQPQANITRTEDFQDWKLVCGTPPGQPDAREACHLLQSVVVSETEQRVLQAEVGKTQQGTIMQLTLPLGIFLPPGIEISIDGGEKTRLPVDICRPGGCTAATKLEGEMLEKMKAGQRAVITFTNPQLKEVDVPLSLIGFTAGFANVT